MGGTVTIPPDEYERLVAVAEDAGAVASVRARLAAGEEEPVPEAVVARLRAGESPGSGCGAGGGVDDLV